MPYTLSLYIPFYSICFQTYPLRFLKVGYCSGSQAVCCLGCLGILLSWLLIYVLHGFCHLLGHYPIILTFFLMINRLARLLCALAWVFVLEAHAGTKPQLLPNLTQPNTFPVVDENQRYLCVALY